MRLYCLYSWNILYVFTFSVDIYALFLIPLYDYGRLTMGSVLNYESKSNKWSTDSAAEPGFGLLGEALVFTLNLMMDNEIPI